MYFSTMCIFYITYWMWLKKLSNTFLHNRLASSFGLIHQKSHGHIFSLVLPYCMLQCQFPSKLLICSFFYSVNNVKSFDLLNLWKHFFKSCDQHSTIKCCAETDSYISRILETPYWGQKKSGKRHVTSEQQYINKVLRWFFRLSEIQWHYMYT